MAHICICKYPLLIIDNRDGKGIEYFAMPIEAIKGGDMPIPDIDYEETKGLDGITRGYISVTWQKVKDSDIVKKYDVVSHVVTAGCQLEEASKGEDTCLANGVCTITDVKDGKLTCDEKNIYVVLHPVTEWVEQHIVELSPLEATK